MDGLRDPHWFSGHMVIGQGQTAGLCTNNVRSISSDFSARKLPNLVQVVDDQYWYSGHMIKGQTAVLLKKCCPLNISRPLWWSCQTWYNGCPYKVDDPYFQVTWSKVKVTLEKNVVCSKFGPLCLLFQLEDLIVILLFISFLKHFLLSCIYICTHKNTLI